jgi:phosphohistidine phosphatase
MKRTLIVIRHAKSSWATPGQPDYDRPLNERGLRDAPEMGRRLKKAGIVPQLLVSSTAKRAEMTAKLVAGGLGYDAKNIQWEDRLYHAPPAIFEEVIYGLDDALQSVAIVAHNPGISEFAHSLDPNHSIGDLPTCGIVAVHFEAERWNEFALKSRKLILHDYPKKEQ